MLLISSLNWGCAKATLEFAGQGKGVLRVDQAQLFDVLAAAAHVGGHVLTAIVLDAIWIGAELTACSGRACHGRERPPEPGGRWSGHLG